ncbi:MAG: DNA alkylation repair protein [Bacillus sp. (in: firmicutes)]
MDKYVILRERFEQNKDEANAVHMSKYMRDKFVFYGLSTPKRRALYKEILKNEKSNRVIDWDFLDQCYEDDHREFQYLVLDYLAAMKKFLAFEDIPRIMTYLKTKQLWDTIDKLDRIVGNIADDRVSDVMLTWSLDDDLWLRRAAIDHQIGRKEKTDKELLSRIIVNNFGSHEFFINKAIGWSLRDYSKVDPDWVRDFLKKHKTQMDSLCINEASKYIR